MKRGAMGRGKPISRVSIRQKKKRDRWARLRILVFAREGGWCAHCGVSLHAYAWECHHRKLRSQGGLDDPANLVALCPDSHRWAHDQRLESEPLGFIVPSHTDPALVPVAFFDGSSRRLSEEAAA